MTMRILPCGDTGVLVEVADLDAVFALRSVLAADPSLGIVDLVPGARTLLVRFDPAIITAAGLAAELRGHPPHAVSRSNGPRIRLPVEYNGEDLEEVAQLTGLSVQEVIEAHCAAEYAAAFSGFVPGFAYLIGLDSALHLPRRPTPRTRVPSGSVAIADGFTGVYPREGPGGWRLLGRTKAVLWDAGRDPPALLVPGVTVRFVTVRR